MEHLEISPTVPFVAACWPRRQLCHVVQRVIASPVFLKQLPVTVIGLRIVPWTVVLTRLTVSLVLASDRSRKHCSFRQQTRFLTGIVAPGLILKHLKEKVPSDIIIFRLILFFVDSKPI